MPRSRAGDRCSLPMVGAIWGAFCAVHTVRPEPRTQTTGTTTVTNRVFGPTAAGVTLVALLACGASEGAQQSFATGQNIAPAYEGWEQNEDGSFNLLFGYMNRNWEEVFDIPIGPENNLDPEGRTTVNRPIFSRDGIALSFESASRPISGTMRLSGR